MSTLPAELILKIIQYMYPYLPGNEGKVATLAHVNRGFYNIVCEILYRSIILPMLSDDFDPEDPDYVELEHTTPSFKTLAENDKLASFVHTFKCWDGDEADILEFNGLVDQPTLHQAADNMINLRTLRLTPNSFAAHMMRTMHLRPATLQSLTIIGVDPRKYMWDASAVAQAGSLANLTHLHFRINAASGNRDLWILVLSYIVAVAEPSCPSLESLSVDHSESGYSRSESSITNLTEDREHGLTSVADRAKEAETGNVPCKLTALKHLSLKLKFRQRYGSPAEEKISDYKRYTDWIISFFGTCLQRICSMEIVLFNNLHTTDLDFVHGLCNKAGRQLKGFKLSKKQELSLQWSNNVSTSPALGVVETLKRLEGESPSLSPGESSEKELRETLTTLEVLDSRLLFSAKLGQDLGQWTNLEVLSIRDDLQSLGKAAGLINGGWLDLDEYKSHILSFIAHLPKGLRDLRLTIDAYEASLDHDEFEFDVSTVFETLRALKCLHIACWTKDDDGSVGPFPENELFVRRLSCGADPRKKILSYVYVEETYQCGNDHRSISRRKNCPVTLKDQEFMGEDANLPWTYEENDIIMIKSCHCGASIDDPFRLAERDHELEWTDDEGEDGD